MQLTFKNKHIYFALAQCWEQLPLAFKYQVQQAVHANADDEAVQNIVVSPELLARIYSNVVGMPEGMSAAPNKSMKDHLMPQLEALAQHGDSEALQVIATIQEIDEADQAKRAALIQDSRNRIIQA